MQGIIRPFDREALRAQFRAATPFPFFVLEGFLEPAFLADVLAAYPRYDDARELGREFSAVNEKRKVQVTDSSRFPPPVKRLADVLSGDAFLAEMEYVTGIPRLLPDPTFDGGGMHLTSSSGRLDVHVDFNLLGELPLFRRLNILVYLNPAWEKDWGGSLELWDAEVKHCHHSFLPLLNRCVVFETSERSYHGVTPIRCPDGVARQSFAAYYYTREAPAAWDGSERSTIFRARPDEKFRGWVMMPLERMNRRVAAGLRRARSRLGRLLRG